MLDILFALFGGAYYTAKIVSDKSATKEYNRQSKARFAWHNERVERWKEQVIDRALEENLTNFIADPYNYDKVWEEVQTAYQRIPSYKGLDRILLHEDMVVALFGKRYYTKKERGNIVAAHRKEALDIMLSKRGKVRGPQVCYLDRILIAERGAGEDSRSVWDGHYDFVLFLRDTLRENGVNARPIFMSGLFAAEHEAQAYDMEDVEKYRYLAGRFVWLPLTFYDDNLQYVPV